jgi:hypothetical protein
LRNRNALLTTDTELRLIASAARKTHTAGGDGGKQAKYAVSVLAMSLLPRAGRD